MKSRAKTRSVLVLACAGAAFGCSGDFDTSRSTAPRGTLGHELFSMICDRVGAQALREDVTGGSYHAICHADATGAYAASVDQSLLTPLDADARDQDGHPVSLAVNQANRAHNVARIEAVGRQRDAITGALDAAIPDTPIAIKDVANPDTTKSCGVPAGAQTDGLHRQLGKTLSRFTDLYDDRTIPLLTEAVGHVLDTIKSSPDAQAALARMDARQGYRPSSVAIGVAQPILAYPRLVDFANSLLTLIASDSSPYSAGLFDPAAPLPPVVASRASVPGAASAQFQQLLSVLHEELRTDVPDAPTGVLATTPDANDPTRPLFNRPLHDLEIARRLLFPSLAETPAPFDSSSHPLVTRDGRGVAVVPLLPSGKVPAPFVDGDGDSLPDLNPLGQFVTADGSRVPSPLFSIDGVDGPRSVGLALNGASPMYAYVDTRATVLAKVTRDLVPMLDPKNEALLQGLARGLPLLFGPHDASAASSKTYPPDPNLPQAWALQHPTTPAPANLGTTPVVLPYAAFHPEKAPLADLFYAVGQVLADPTTDDTLSLFRQLVKEHPDALGRLVGVGLQIKDIANAHAEAHIPAASLLWDELLDVFAKIAAVYDPKTGGILEDVIAAFGKDETVALRDAFTAYIDFKDELTYQNAKRPPASGAPDLNGPAFDLLTGGVTAMSSPVDRTQPDTGANRSALQKFMQLLHDANGLGACTKEGAVAHLNLTIPGFGTNLAVDYPTGALAKAACVFVGGGVVPPDPMPACGILRIPNVAKLLLDVALGRAQFDIPDPCLNAILNNATLTGLVGGPDAFLQAQSGITGFDLHPTVNGISRLVYYDTPHDADLGDSSFPTTENFVAGVLDPVPSMACDLAPPAPAGSAAAGIPLRTCKSFDLTLRGRDPDALFPIEQLDFIKNVQPLAAAFDDHGQPLLFVQLFDTLHAHWGSPAQSKAECDPTLPKTDARWCSQDGAVTYEPLLSAALKTDLFAALRDFVPLLQATKVQHCDAVDAKGQCTATTAYDGVHVLAEAIRGILDPARAAKVGLVDRKGSKSVARNDGTLNPQVTPIYLLIDALKEIDQSFADDAKANAGDTTKHAAWWNARSQLADTFFAAKGSGATATWANPVVPRVIPELIDVVRGDLAAYCPTARIDGACPWARTKLTEEMSTVIGGPLFAASIDLLEAVRANDPARVELEQLAQYLLGPTAPAAEEASLTAIHDVLQLFGDDANLSPLWNALSEGTGASLVGDGGKVVRRSAADALVEVLTRVLARAYDAHGTEICADEVDPNRTFAAVLSNLVTAPSANALSPIEVLIDAIADINRANPGLPFTTKLDGGDYASIGAELSDFLQNEQSGLEQVYEVIREATLD